MVSSHRTMLGAFTAVFCFSFFIINQYSGGISSSVYFTNLTSDDDSQHYETGQLRYRKPATVDGLASNTDQKAESVFEKDKFENFQLHNDGDELSQRAKSQTHPPVSQKQRPNIVFIIADDLRPQLSPYYDEPQEGAARGKSYPYPPQPAVTYTPHIARLADSSAVFLHAYCQISLCGPSRASLMTSRGPDTTRVYTNTGFWRQVGGNFTTLPQYFKQHGYHTLGVGKVFHPHDSTPKGDVLSWSEPYYEIGRYDGYHNRTLGRQSAPYIMQVEDDTRRDDPLSDDIALGIALQHLRLHASAALNNSKPLFLALGIGKPHPPLICPKKYYDLYPLETDGLFSLPKDSEGTKMLTRYRQGYSACVSYVDELVGTLLVELEKLGLSDNTIITFTADHGFHVGENGQTGKMCTTELANHVPLIIKIPGKTDEGIRSKSIVESLDIFPTLVDAAGLPPLSQCPHRNSSQIELCTEGVSLMPLLDEPRKELKYGAMSEIGLQSYDNSDYVAYTLRNSSYRFMASARVVYTNNTDGRYSVTLDWSDSPCYPQLFNHRDDSGELTDLGQDPRYANVVADFVEELTHRLTDIDGVADVTHGIPTNSISILSSRLGCTPVLPRTPR